MKQFIVLLSMTLLLMVSLVSATSLNESLISCWSLDSLSDSNSLNNLNEPASNPPSLSTAEKKLGSGSYYWDGTENGLYADDDVSLRFNLNDFTIAGWIKFESDAPDSNPVIIGKGDTGADEWMLRIGDKGTGAVDFYGAGGNIRFNTGSPPTGITNVSNGVWHFFVAKRNSTLSKMIINTTESVGSDASDDFDLSTTKILEIGNGDQSSTRQWKGYIDELAIWNRSLNSSEISELWNNNDGLNCSTITSAVINVTPSVNASTNQTGLLSDECVLDRSCCESFANSLDFICLRDDTNNSIPNPIKVKNLYVDDDENYAFLGQWESKFWWEGDGINDYTGWQGIGRTGFGQSLNSPTAIVRVPASKDRLRATLYGLYGHGSNSGGSQQRSESLTVPISNFTTIIKTRIKCISGSNCNESTNGVFIDGFYPSQTNVRINFSNIIDGSYFGWYFNYTQTSGTYEILNNKTEWIVAINRTANFTSFPTDNDPRARYYLDNTEIIDLTIVFTSKLYEDKVSDWLSNPDFYIDQEINKTQEIMESLNYPSGLNVSQKNHYYWGIMNYKLNSLHSFPSLLDISAWGSNAVFSPRMASYPATWIWDSFISCMGILSAVNQSDSNAYLYDLCKQNLNAWVEHDGSNGMWYRQLEDDNTVQSVTQPNGGWDLVTLNLYNRSVITKDYMCNSAYPSLKAHYDAKNDTSFISKIDSTTWCRDDGAGNMGWDGSDRYGGESKCQLDTTGWHYLSATSLNTMAKICENGDNDTLTLHSQYLKNGLSYMYDDSLGDFCDINSSFQCFYTDGTEFSYSVSVASAWAIMANATTETQLNSVIEHWNNPQWLGTNWAVPTIHIKHPAYDGVGTSENWMGTIWSPPNMIAMQGLINLNRNNNVTWLADKIIQMVDEGAGLGIEAYQSNTSVGTGAPVFAAPAKVGYIWGDSQYWMASNTDVNLLSVLNAGVQAEPPGEDTTAPVQSALQASSITNQSATVSYNTNETANGTIWLYNSSERTAANLIDKTTYAGFALSRSKDYTGLFNSTIYYVNTTYCDPNGNCDSTNTLSFTTASNAETPASEVTSIDEVGQLFINGLIVFSAFYAVLVISLIGVMIIRLYKNDFADFKLTIEIILAIIISAIIILMGVALINQFIIAL